MTKKIKLAEAARDLKIENQEIIDLMENTTVQRERIQHLFRQKN